MATESPDIRGPRPADAATPRSQTPADLPTKPGDDPRDIRPSIADNAAGESRPRSAADRIRAGNRPAETPPADRRILRPLRPSPGGLRTSATRRSADTAAGPHARPCGH